MKKTKTLTQCAVFAALMCVISPITVPLGAIPLTFSLFVLMLSAVILGSTRAAISSAVYLFIGACGLPVFASASGGVGALFSLTGGYLWSYPLIALVAGIGTKNEKPFPQTLHAFLMCLCALLVCYSFGTVQYMIVSHTTLVIALKTAVLAFLPFDILKALGASVLGVQIKRALLKSKLLLY